MGGKLVILMHDFQQILPVVPQGRRADSEGIIYSVKAHANYQT